MALASLYEAMDYAARYRGRRDTFAELATNASRLQPRLLVVEDLHWADRIILEYLATIARALTDCPMLLIMTSRPEGDPLDQAWRGSTEGCPIMTLDLGPLRTSEAEALAGAHLEGRAEFARRCIERAGGNPLFLEQLLRHAEERADGVVPGSVQSLVQARMDQLEPVDRQALQAASVFGQRFGLDALRNLLESPGYTCAALIERLLVRPAGDELLFGHALIRDAVYDTLLRATRRDWHSRAAIWFADREPVLHAEHLDRAEDPRAAMAYLAAARSEAAAYRYERARPLLDRGLELARDSSEAFALTCFSGELLHDLGVMIESRRSFERALEVASDDGERCRVWLGLARVKRVIDDLEGAFADLERAEAAALGQGLKEQLARIHFLRGNLCFPKGDIEGCLTAHQASLDLGREIGSAELEAQALGGLGDAEYVRGRMITAHGYFVRCVAICREHGFGRVEVANLPMVAHSGLYFRPQGLVLEEAIAAVEAARRVGNQRAELTARVCASFSSYAALDLDTLRAHEGHSHELVLALGAWRFEVTRLLFLGLAAVVEGDRARAVELIEAALANAKKTGLGFHGPRIFGGLALALEDPAARRQALADGEALIEAGCVGHNQPWFYRDAIDVALDLGDFDEAERFAQALEDFSRPEPLAWCDLFIARGRALAHFGRGRRDEALIAELGHVRDEARRLEIELALPAIETALTALSVGRESSDQP